MKRLFAMLMALVCVFSCAAAEDIDISGLSFDQLVALRNRINLAIWNSREWQEVTVPQGVWIVGEDIPAGSWSVRCAADFTAVVTIGDELYENGQDVKPTLYSFYKRIESPNYRHYEPGVSLESFSFTVKNGDFISISGCDVIFSPASGKPDLGFR